MLVCDAVCTRDDGTILKPSASATYLDRFYHAAPGEERFELTAAPSSLAASASSRLDPAADSRAILGENAQGELWHWNILSSEVALGRGAPNISTCGGVTNNTAYSNTVVGMDRSIRTPEACCAACNAFAACQYWNLVSASSSLRMLCHGACLFSALIQTVVTPGSELGHGAQRLWLFLQVRRGWHSPTARRHQWHPCWWRKFSWAAATASGGAVADTAETIQVLGPRMGKPGMCTRSCGE